MTSRRDLWPEFLKAMHQEIVPALGCTEPISLALASAIAARTLGQPPEQIEGKVSANLMKNGMGVIVPGTGVPGLYIAAAVGASGGDPDGKLLVLDKLTQEQVKSAKQMVADGHVTIGIADTPHVLYAEATVFDSVDSVCVAIADAHTNIVRIEQNGIVVFEAKPKADGADGDARSFFDDVKARDVYEFATEAPLDRIKFILQAAELNNALAEEGMGGVTGSESAIS